MASTIFYSWQSDLPNATNRGFIQTALERAAAAIQSDATLRVEPVVDRDTANLPGSPDIAAAIFEKIDACDVFVCDVSIINAGSQARPTPNPNVLIELGYALKRLGWSQIILVFNSAIAQVEALPFDLRMKRVLAYEANAGEADRSPQRKILESQLTRALEVIYRNLPASPPAPEPEEWRPGAQELAWREDMHALATRGFSNAGLSGSLEAFAVLTAGRQTCTHQQLLTAANESMIQTFGWPIGVMDLVAEHMRPKPTTFGIQTSFLQPGEKYDFWALRRDGTFYLFKSLFEDQRAERQLFFNTRVVRTTEILLYLSRLHERLGAAKSTPLYVWLRHSGLRGRNMSATSNRLMFRRHGPAEENLVESQVVFALEDIPARLPALVKELLTPLFVLFDFFEVSDQLLEQIVREFEKGRVT